MSVPSWERSRGDVYEEARQLTVEDLIDREQACGVRFGPFHRQWLMERAPEKVRRYLELAKLHPELVGTRGYSMGMDVADVNPSSFTAVSASATETLFWQNPAVWTPIPGGDMRAGKAYKVSYGGVFSSTATQGVLTWTPRAGTTTSGILLGASNATAPAASLTTQALYGEFTLGIRSVDLAYTAITGTGNGFTLTQGAAAATGTVYVMGGTVATTITNAAATGLVIDLTISVASQSYTCQWVVIQSLN